MRTLLRAVVVVLCVGGPVAAAVSCKNITVTPLAFGNYDVYGATPLDTAGTISYSCPPPLTPTVTIDNGLSFANGNRRMSLGGADFLEYQVYVDAARTTVWSATVGVSVAASNATSVPIYGRIFAQQDVRVGAYTDTLVVTFNF